MYRYRNFFATSALLLFVQIAHAEISVLPLEITQGSPVFVTVSGVPKDVLVTSLTLDSATVPVFFYNNIQRGLYGISILGKAGNRTITATLSDGSIMQKDIYIAPLLKETRVNPPVPQQLGGNSVKNEIRVVSILEKENAAISNLFSQPKALWRSAFVPPLMQPVVTDTFGYLRSGGASVITHKGTDYRAKEGTPVIAMNRGVVRLAKKFTVYGNTIIIDHGLGVQTLYMHLSKIKVAKGQLVEQGAIIGYSGMTGYAERPHLHLSVRINGASVDPEKFSTLFSGTH